MERVPLQKRIVFLFLEPVRRPRALLVARAHVTRCRLAFIPRLRAFARDDFLRHYLFLRVFRLRLFFLSFAALFFGQTEDRRDRLANPRSFVLLLELRLAFDGEPRERDRLEARMRNWFARHLTDAIG